MKLAISAGELRESIIQSLQQQGFRLQGERLLPPPELDKERVRLLHSQATLHKTETKRGGLARHEGRLRNRLAEGFEVVPEQVVPRLVEVQPESEDELLFRYASLHWSIPVSSGYGRRLRFLVVDEHNEKLIGIFGLGDPVFTLGQRDAWVGWDKKGREQRLHNVLDAFVVGAVPPYSFLLCGKLVAMMVVSNEVREAFRRKYAGRPTVIRERPLAGELALVTTTSALGRSSLYNRLRYHYRLLYQSVGYTAGSGEFHFSNGLYDAMSDFAAENCQPTAKHDRWGSGFRSRREVVKKCLAKVGLSEEWLYHGIRREIFVAPVAANCQRFLQGEDRDLEWFDQPADGLFQWFRERWLIPRSQRDRRYQSWNPLEWTLWPQDGAHG